MPASHARSSIWLVPVRESRGWWRFGGALLAAICLVSPGGLLWAQSTTQPQSVGQPIQLAPPSLFAPTGSEEAAKSRSTGLGPAKRDIEVNRLGDIEAEAIGVLELDDGGFGAAMWRGSGRATIERLFMRLPADYRSASLRDLARRLLLSNAATPAGQGETSLIALRVGGLAALGDFQGVAALSRVVPQRLIEEPVARARVDSLLLTGELDAACRDVRNGMVTYHGELFWAKALVFCQIVEGQADEAGLGLALLREQMGDGDPAYFALVEAISGVDADLPATAASTPLLAAMLRFSGNKPPGDLLDHVPGGLLPMIAQMPNLSLEDRALAAERAVASGALEPEALRAIYAAFSFVPEQLAQVLEVAPALEGPLGRALLYQAARAESLPATLAEILGVALESARKAGHYVTQVRVLVLLLAEVPPQPELLWFAETAGRSFFATHRYEQAGAWFALARSQVGVEPAAAETVARLWPYARLAGFRAAVADESLSAWRAAWIRADDGGAAASDGGAAEQLLLRASFQALGVTDVLPWSELANGSGSAAGEPLPDVPLLYALQDAASAGRSGEAVLAALIILGTRTLGDVHPVALGAVLGALKALGLETEAQNLAVEAALARGI